MNKKHELYDWIELHRDKHLTIEDIDEMEVGGKKYDVVIFDRNFDEAIWDNFEEFRIYSPEEMFKYSRHTVSLTMGLGWDIRFGWGETIRHPFHLDVSGLPTN